MTFTTVLFDLDGTLLPMDQEVFAKTYMKTLAASLAPRGYEPQSVVETIWNGMKAMVRNDGTRTNEAVFWEVFAAVFGARALDDRPAFDEFYRTTFQTISSVCGHDPRAAAIVHGLKAKGIRVALATNPLFPAIATESRIRWAGLEPSDFELYTTYENSGFCKPNPDYYKNILDRIGCTAEECLMVGNDVAEDMVARTLGMGVFLLTDCLINKNNSDISGYPQGDFDTLKSYLQEHC